MRDSYHRFFSLGYISKEQFFDFGLKETIYADLQKAQVAWKDLKQRISNGDPVFIRGYGRNAGGTHLFQEFYRHLLPNANVLKDPVNNTEPTKLIKQLTVYSKTKSLKHQGIINYQVSHVFGRTKNVYAFAAPWNIALIPKIVDPLTGHEAKGEIVGEYTKLFQKQTYEYFRDQIDDFNRMMLENEFQKQTSDALAAMSAIGTFKPKEILKLAKSASEDFRPITISP